MTQPSARAEIVVDLAAIRHNVRRLRELAAPALMMTVVKADGYGHGMVPVARAAREAGADWLGVATIDEAVALREAGDEGPLLCWLAVPGEEFAEALTRDIEVTAYSVDQLEEIAAAARGTGVLARVQLKVDTGLNRGGVAAQDWPAVIDAALAHEAAGTMTVTGIWSHFASSDEPGHPANEAQEKAFAGALDEASRAGLRPPLRHLANSAATVLRPGSHYDLVRCGIASYGLDPAPGHTEGLGLVPAMTARVRLVMVKPVAAGEGVSYGHTWIADHDTTVGLVPAGYGEGVPRHASNRAEVGVNGERHPIRGRVCMDQFVVDLGETTDVRAGDVAVLFGTGAEGEPTATDWAQACGTINYEIVTRIGGRFQRVVVDSEADR